MKKNTLFCIILLFIGCASSLLLKPYIGEAFGNEFHIQNFGVAQLDTMGLLCKILMNRGNLFLMLLLLMETPLKNKIPFLLAAVLSLLGGLYLSICFMQFRIKGGLIFFLSIFPHTIFYGIVVMLMMALTNRSLFYKKKEIGTRFVLLGMMLLMFFVGALLEVWTSSSILQKLFLSAF